MPKTLGEYLRIKIFTIMAYTTGVSLAVPPRIRTLLSP